MKSIVISASDICVRIVIEVLPNQERLNELREEESHGQTSIFDAMKGSP